MLQKSPLWSNRDFRLILLGRTLSTAGTAMTTLALVLRLHGAGHGPGAIAGLLAAFAVPTVLTMNLAGRVADGHDSRRVLTVALATQVVAIASLVVVDSLAGILAAVVVCAVGQAFASPVWAALVPRVVGDEHVGAAVGWQQGLASVAGPLGGAAAGVLVGATGGRIVFAVDAATTAVLLVVAVAVRTRRRPVTITTAGATEPGTRRRRTGGLAVVRRDRIVWSLFVALIVMVLVVEGVNAAEVFLARDEIGVTPTQYGAAEALAGVAGLVGAMLAGRRGGPNRLVLGALGGFGLAAAGIAVAGVAGNVAVYVGVATLVALVAGMANACAATLVVTRTADVDRGKVQAALNGLARAAGLVALAAGAAATGIAGPRAVFVVGGLAAVVVMGLAGARLGLIARPALLPAGRPVGARPGIVGGDA